MAPSKDPQNLSQVRRFAAAGSAACIAEIVTIPLDTAKVRLQIQGGAASTAGNAQYRGIFGTIATISRDEGVTALWKGLVPGLLRQMTFATLRIGLYEPVRNLYMGNDTGNPPIWKKIAAGMTTGTIGICVANPTDLVKIRLQAEGRLPEGVARRYNGTMDAFVKIARSEGIVGLWRGLGPNIARNSIITAAELASYDQIKQMILDFNLLSDNIPCHLTSAMGAGFTATCIGSPVDVIKTRVMNSQTPEGKPLYKNSFDCAFKMFKNEGLGSFYKGFVPNFMRIGTWNVAMFLSFEQLKRLLARD